MGNFGQDLGRDLTPTPSALIRTGYRQPACAGFSFNRPESRQL